MRMTNPLQLAAALLFTASGVIRLATDPGSALGWLFLVLGALSFVLALVVLNRKPHTPWSDELLAPGRAVVLWQDDCPRSRALMRRFNTDGRFAFIDVNRDETAAAKVRALMDGALATPVVLTRNAQLANPTANDVMRALKDSR